MANCSHEDSRLSCIDCSAPICGACLVQCPVGFRCRSCVGGAVKSAAGSRWAVIKTFALCVAIGFGAGWIMPFIRVPYIDCIICFVLGLLIGRWLTNVIDHSMPGLGVTIVFGLLIGMSLGPYNFLLMSMFQMIGESFTGQGVSIINALGGLLSVLFSPVCFFAGILRPTLRGNRW